MNLPPPFVKDDAALIGVPASPGIVIGKAYLVDRSKVDFMYQSLINEALIEEEVNRFEAAVAQARDQLEEIKAGVPDELASHAYILDTHLLLLKDKL
ncbi:MAG: phosphoenolpyruvate--protein phosphotransferase, partial [Proteobacteria bacterium]|nr:phosphoenolpyruvate--protein phosphotransferase [Pseudomonadota bacterium]